MMAKKEQEETIPDDGDQITCTKISQELKEEVIQKYTQVFTGLGAVTETLPHGDRPNSYPVVNLPSRTIPAPGTSGKSESRVR